MRTTFGPQLTATLEPSHPPTPWPSSKNNTVEIVYLATDDEYYQCDSRQCCDYQHLVGICLWSAPSLPQAPVPRAERNPTPA
ncbi:MAG: hypothetical protein MZV63_61515 [Marinilabiliales bacterium]|nr:hypothetical protein [Marinilabiliales bacterium]